MEVKFGSHIKCKYLVVNVNCHAENFEKDKKEEDWKEAEVIIEYGEDWMYGKISIDFDVSSENKYLFRNDVGPDGWGSILVCKNIEILPQKEANKIPVVKTYSW